MRLEEQKDEMSRGVEGQSQTGRPIGSTAASHEVPPSLYDELRANAAHICRLCCRQECFATHPMEPCAVCR